MASQPETDAQQEQSRAVVPMTPQREGYAIMKDKAKMFAMSPLIPDHLRQGGPEVAAANCLIALQMAETMGESPLVVMQNIHVVKGKAGFAAQYMIARANASGVFKGRINWRIDRSDANNLSVTAFAYLTETGEEVSFTVDMKMAKAEKWTTNSKYDTMPEVMLRYRSATFLIRFYAPDVMLGYQTAEENEDVVLAATPATPALTSDMLIGQSKPAEPTPEPDATGDDKPDATDAADEEPETVEGEVVGDADVHPAQAKADELIAAIREAGAALDVTSIIARVETDLAAMPEDIANSVHAVAKERKEEIDKARQPTGADGAVLV